MKKQMVLSVLAGLGLMACGSSETAEAPAAQGSGDQAVAPLAAAAAPSAAAVAPSGGGAGFALAPGFMPDPATGSGRAGGATDASSLNDECRGFIASSPNHVLNAQGAFSNLRIVVNGGEADTTLVVRRPDGTYLCNDDEEGLNPVVEGAFAPGEYQIFVGSYSAEDAGSSYRIGISELSSVTPSSLAN